jgi:hypothetical protein
MIKQFQQDRKNRCSILTCADAGWSNMATYATYPSASPTNTQS